MQFVLKNRLVLSCLGMMLLAVYATLALLSQTSLTDYFGSAARLQQFFHTEPDHIRYFQQADSMLDFLFNADALYLPMLYRDLILNGGSYSDWSLPPAPYFFPDMALFFTGSSLTSSPVSAVFLFAALQLLLFWWLGYLALKPLLARSATALLAATAGCLALLACIASGRLPELITLVLSAYHGGIALCALAILALSLRWQRAPDRPHYGLLMGLIMLLASLSDLLAISQIGLPLGATYLLLALRGQLAKQHALAQTGVLAAASLIGALLGKALVPTETLDHHLQFDIGQFATFAHQLAGFLRQLLHDAPLYSALLAVTLVAGSAALVKARRQQDAPQAVALGYLLLTSLSCLAVALLFGKTAPRYLIPLLSLPLFWGLPLLLAKALEHLSQANQRKAGYLAAAAVVTGWVPVVHGNALQLVSDYYPDEIACVDRLALEHRLHAGLTDYWSEKRFTLLSRQQLQLLQATPQLAARHWINSLAPYRRADINFVLLDQQQNAHYRLDTRLLGSEPTESAQCGRYRLEIYPSELLADFLREDLLLQRAQLLADGRPVQIDAARLPSAIDNSLLGNHRISRGQRGHLSFGPYLRLPAGDYSFAMQLTSQTDKPAKPLLVWDVVSAGSVIARGELATDEHPATDRTLNGRFRVPEQADNQEIEVRLYHSGIGTVELKQLTIQSESAE